MIHLMTGNLFEAETQAIVNPVNCVGVMGAGLAARFKQFYPEMFDEYQRLCNEKWLKPGRVHVWQVPSADRYVINFPTKLHWKDHSKINHITQGLDALVDAMTQKGIRSVAIPALGCGLGGLQWEPVRDATIALLQRRAPDAIVHLYAPKA